MSDTFGTPWTITHQAPLSMGFPRQEYWSGLPFPSPGDLPSPGTEPTSPALQADSLPLSHLGSAMGGKREILLLQVPELIRAWSDSEGTLNPACVCGVNHSVNRSLVVATLMSK